MPNERYQSLFGLAGAALRERFLDGAPAGVAAALEPVPDEELAPLLQDLGGHDIAALLRAYAECDAVTDRPSVVFAYTVKGWGLPAAGNPRNHSALLTAAQIDELRAAVGRTRGHRVGPARSATAPAGLLAARRAAELTRAAPPPVRTARAAADSPGYGSPARRPPRRCSAGSWSTWPATPRSGPTW